METESYHIYAKDRVLYWNLNKEDFEEKWQLLNVMVGLLKTDYTEDDLSYIKAYEKIINRLNQACDSSKINKIKLGIH